MGKYSIKLKYSSNHHEEDILDLSWDDLVIAEENLLRIKEHYEMYLDSTDYLIDYTQSQKPWFVNVPQLFRISTNSAIDPKQKIEGDYEYRINIYEAKYNINLKNDNGDEVTIFAFWCGYGYEILQEIEIISNNPLPKITFNN